METVGMRTVGLRRRRLVAAAVALVAGVAVAAGVVAGNSSASAESNGGTRVMPLGDSITDGVTVPGGYRIGLWQRFTTAGYKVDFVGSLSNGPASLGDHDHEGHSGWRIDQIDANIVGWLNTYQPHTVLLHIGTNDVLQNFDVANAPARLSTLIDHITATVPTAEVFVAQIIPISNAGQDATARNFNAAIPGIVQSKVNAGKHVHVVDLHSALTTADLADGVHPNAGGYDKMAAVWYNALLSVPGSIGSPGGASPTPTTASPTASRTSAPPTSPPPTGPNGGCAATYRLVNSWPGGLQGEVTVANGGSTTLSGWTVHLTLASGQTISSLWNGVNSGTSGAITVKNASYNGTLAGGASTSFGYTATGSNSTSPTGVTCTSP